MSEQHKTLAILRRMYDLLEPEAAWCQEAGFRDADGVPTVLAGQVSSRCLAGAWETAAQAEYGSVVDCWSTASFQAVVRQLPEGTTFIWGWNDAPERTQEDVLLVIKHAIADVEGAGE